MTALSVGAEKGSRLSSWPLQKAPGPAGDPRQDPSTFPRSTVPAQVPQKRVKPPAPVLTPTNAGGWNLTGGWKLCSAFEIAGTAAEISMPGFNTDAWYEATVPGTVLTTLVDQGVYPEPTYGLNNLAIPESLSRVDYWYRTELTLPSGESGLMPRLVFHGINYNAEVWANGKRLGQINGAFQRGIFDLAESMRGATRLALAVRVSPVPHPGVPHEESLAAGAGPNGGAMCFDGPTFFCTEGWDWIPGIRDRCTGIWQDVELRLEGAVTIGDVQVVSKLPLPDRSSAEVTLSVLASNVSKLAQTVVVHCEFEGVRIQKSVTLNPGTESDVVFSPREFQELRIETPRLWWPNGYGKPELYHATFTTNSASGQTLSTRRFRFGIRELSYDLTALDPAGELQRKNFTPATAGSELIVDSSHEGLRESTSGWVPTWTQAARDSKAITAAAGVHTAPFLVIKVNGVPIVAKGGNWGLDEALKRCSRDRLEPFIRLERDAHLTMIRNWCGQSTEEAFFELCDEYGIMVWSDFWASTQNWNLQPGDLKLWLDNAADTLQRYRHHPSIVLWCGRNEGVLPPALNLGLERLIRTIDGTRYFQAGSIQINLLNSGPWVHRDPVKYFSEYGLGFSTELGLPCVPTADAIRAMMPVADQWPISDTWAYHDWHQADHGEVQEFMADLSHQYGAANGLDDFCRKAQMLNYVGHRAIFEGLNARLWEPATGRLLWMSHPAWPSTEWQLYSSDYEPNGAYFGTQKACEPLHVQLNLDDRNVVVANTTVVSSPGLTVRAEIFNLKSERLAVQEASVDGVPNATTTAFKLDEKAVASIPLYFVRLTLNEADGALRSENFYWQARKPEDHRLLNDLPAVKLTGSIQVGHVESRTHVSVTVVNSSDSLALMIKPTLRNAGGGRLLPAFASDGYFSLLPGSSRTLVIDSSAFVNNEDIFVTLDGWNTSGTLAAKSGLVGSERASLPALTTR